MIEVIKVGGAVVENPTTLAAFLDRFAAIEGPKVLIHGGGRSATAMAERLGIETKMVDGRRITDAETLEVVTMVYGGKVGRSIVVELQNRGIRALSLTGADMGLVRAHRRPIKNGIDYGFVGDVDSVDATMLQVLLAQGIVPVIAPLSYGDGSLLNTNADTMAQSTASALAQAGEEVTLRYCFEKPGVLADPDDDNSVIATIRATDRDRLVADGTISGGMIPKIDNALQAVAEGVKRVCITSATTLGHDSGTQIY